MKFLNGVAGLSRFFMFKDVCYCYMKTRRYLYKKIPKLLLLYQGIIYLCFVIKMQKKCVILCCLKNSDY